MLTLIKSIISNIEKTIKDEQLKLYFEHPEYIYFHSNTECLYIKNSDAIKNFNDISYKLW